MNQQHHRRSIRLKGYDYSRSGAYFVTICTHERSCLFGVVVGGDMRLNDAGRIAEQCWRDIPAHFPHVQLDAFVIMPNHVHGVLWIVDNVGAKNLSPVGAENVPIVGGKNFSPLQQSSSPCGTSKTIGSVVRGFKIGVTKWFRQNTFICNVWQRNYVVRNNDQLNRIREYIVNNPKQWEMDQENPYIRPAAAHEGIPI